jgi:hypothetical protein
MERENPKRRLKMFLYIFGSVKESVFEGGRIVREWILSLFQ